MGYSQEYLPYDTLATKIVKNNLRFVSRLLSIIGKPLFFFLSYSLIILAYIVSITGYGIRTLLHKVPSPIINISLRKKEIAKKGVIFKASRKKYFLIKKNAFKFLKLILNFFIKIFLILLKIIKILIISLKKILIDLIFKPLKILISKIYINSKINYKSSQLKLISIISRTKRPKSKISLAKLKLLRFTFFFFSILFLIILATFWQIIIKDLPSPYELTKRQVDVSTKIYDRNGILLYTIYKDKNRTPVKLENVPPQVKLATIAIEDSEFYSHPGFSIKGIVRAIYKNLKQKELTGGSTITQQLVKNALLSSEKTLIRKLKEITLAIQVELTYSKDEILEIYLNEVSYGGTAYGIQEASRMYFAKDSDQLSLAEAALLAGLPKSPTSFSPFGSNPESAIKRQKEVLNQMKINGFITEEQLLQAEKEALLYTENKTQIKAPHFVMYVRQLLEEKYGKEFIEKGGLEVTTTLDYKIQKLAEEVIKDEVGKLKNLHVGNGAALVIKPTTGEVLAMVGSKDFFDRQADGNVNITLRPRQPGSSIKIINYAYALSNGYTLSSILEDSPVTFLIDDQPPYTPKNYEGGYKGKLTLRSAFAQSRNIPAVRVLDSYGVENMIEMGQKMGITTWTDPKNYGLSLTLGGGEVRLLDLTQAYATLANYGNKPEITTILKIRDYKGKLIEENKCQDGTNLIAKASASESANILKDVSKSSCNGKEILDPRVAFLIIDVLKDNDARSPAFGSNSLLVIPNHKEVAVKTGTSNDLRDNLAIGFNQEYLVAAWVGNNDNSPMARIASGVTGATPIFNKIMTTLLEDEENHPWQVPEKLVQTPICTLTGTLPCEGCPIRMEWFLEENKPEIACSSEWFNEVKVEQEGEVDQVENENTGQILPEAAKIEVIDTRKNKKQIPRFR